VADDLPEIEEIQVLWEAQRCNRYKMLEIVGTWKRLEHIFNIFSTYWNLLEPTGEK
jgi:hypothetical protein